MKMKDLMLESLTALLEKNETLMCPIYGSLHQGNTQHYAFFGFTERFLLIALLSGKTITYTIRIPLDIKSVSIKQNPILREYTINVSFNEGAPCRLSAFPRVMTIDTQKENLPHFIKTLKDRAKSVNSIELKNVDGTKIRWQYFSVYIYALLSFLPAILIMISILDIKAGKFDWANITDGILTEVIILSPLFLLSFANRFIFGKLICVVNENGLYLENDFIPWEKIKKIEYHPEIPQKHRVNFTYATVMVEDSKFHEYELDIVHFPIYGLRRIKKYAPDMKITTSRSQKILIAVILLLPTLFGLIIPLVM